MRDLFDALDHPDNLADPRKEAARIFSGPIVKLEDPRTRGSATLKQAEPRIVVRASSFAIRPESGVRTSSLLNRRARLEKEIEKIEPQLAEARATEEPFREEFRSAHADLVKLHEERQSGDRTVAKWEMLSGYDRRMNAGHSWHPFRKAAEELQRWLILVREDLKAVNKEIGI